MIKESRLKPTLWTSCSPDTSRFKDVDELNPEVPVYMGGTVPRRVKKKNKEAHVENDD